MTTALTAVNKLALLVAAGAMIAIGLASAANAEPAPQYDRRGRPVAACAGLVVS